MKKELVLLKVFVVPGRLALDEVTIELINLFKLLLKAIDHLGEVVVFQTLL